jgi:hypothetical protein
MNKPGPWMRYAPSSEQEVVVLFALLLPHLPFRVEVEEVREAFPDCLAWRVHEDGSKTKLKIEFELYASNFIAHGHPCDGCDYIVCWKDDLEGVKALPPRIALEPLAEKASPPVVASPMLPKYGTTTWDATSFLKECRGDLRLLQGDFLRWASHHGEVVFGKGAKNPSWSFAIPAGHGGRCVLFGVYAKGAVWLYGSPNIPDRRRARYIECFQAVQKLKTALESGRAWLEVDIQGEGVLDALKAAALVVAGR